MGVPALNEAATIRRVIEIASAGLAALPHEAEIWLADGGSSDGTVERFLATRSHAPLSAVVDSSSPGGKGRNVLSLVRKAVERSVDALVIIDADTTSTRPEWIGELSSPVVEGRADYVSPVFAASQGGPLRHLVSRPLVYGFAGGDISQPTGGEVCLSSQMCRRVLEAPMTDPAVQGYGIDIHLALECIGTGLPFDQAELGVKRHRARPWSTITFIAEAVATAGFKQLYRHRDRVLTWETPLLPKTSPSSNAVSTAVLDRSVLDLEVVTQRFLITRDLYADQYRMLLQADQEALGEALRGPNISREAWRTIVSRFTADAVNGGNAEHLASALMPIMLGRMASFGNQLLDSPADLARSVDEDLTWIASNRLRALSHEAVMAEDV